MKQTALALAILFLFPLVSASYNTLCDQKGCTWSSESIGFTQQTNLSFENGRAKFESLETVVYIEPSIDALQKYTYAEIKNVATNSFSGLNLGDKFKWAYQLSNLNPSMQSEIKSVTFNLKYTGDGIVTGNAININGVEINFQDLIDNGFKIEVKDSHTVIVTQVSGKSALNLDPTITFNATSGLIEDNFVSSGNADTVYSTGNTIRGESYNFVDKNCRLFFWFNTSTIPTGSVITNATLLLNLSSYTTSATRTYNVYNVSEYNWNTLTWNNQPTANIMVGNGSIGSTNRAVYELNLTYHFQEVYDKNNVTFLMVRDSSESSATEYSKLFNSRNNTALGSSPRLIVSYETSTTTTSTTTTTASTTTTTTTTTTTLSTTTTTTVSTTTTTGSTTTTLAPTTINNCGYVITIPGSYTVINNLTSGEAICIEIQTSNVIVDCQNYYLLANGVGQFGIASFDYDVSDIRIKNCNIYGYTTVGIYGETFSNSVIENNTVSGIDRVLFQLENGIASIDPHDNNVSFNRFLGTSPFATYNVNLYPHTYNNYGCGNTFLTMQDLGTNNTISNETCPTTSTTTTTLPSTTTTLGTGGVSVVSQPITFDVGVCLNNNTLATNRTRSITVSGITTNVYETYTKTCDYGCDYPNGMCNPSPLIQLLLWVGIVIGIVLLFTFVKRLI